MERGETGMTKSWLASEEENCVRVVGAALKTEMDLREASEQQQNGHPTLNKVAKDISFSTKR